MIRDLKDPMMLSHRKNVTEVLMFTRTYKIHKIAHDTNAINTHSPSEPAEINTLRDKSQFTFQNPVRFEKKERSAKYRMLCNG